MSSRPGALRPFADLDPVGSINRGRGSPDATLGLLGGFVAKVGPRQLELPRRVERLVAFLALRGRPLQRAYVAGRLWLDSSQEHAYGSLRATICEARRARCPLVQASSTQVALSPLVRVDTEELERCAARVLDFDVGRLTGADLACLVGAGELLPDWYEDWVLEERAHLHELRVLALESAARILITAGRTSEASIAAFTALTAEPLRESSCRLLVDACLATGNRADAVRHLSEFRARLWHQLHLEPSPSMRELIRTHNTAEG